jgi:hypothetical protein
MHNKILQIYRLLVLAFQVSYHKTHPISRAIQQTYTFMWHADLISLLYAW